MQILSSMEKIEINFHLYVTIKYVFLADTEYFMLSI